MSDRKQRLNSIEYSEPYEYNECDIEFVKTVYLSQRIPTNASGICNACYVYINKNFKANLHRKPTLYLVIHMPTFKRAKLV